MYKEHVKQILRYFVENGKDVTKLLGNEKGEYPGPVLDAINCVANPPRKEIAAVIICQRRILDKGEATDGAYKGYLKQLLSTLEGIENPEKMDDSAFEGVLGTLLAVVIAATQYINHLEFKSPYTEDELNEEIRKIHASVSKMDTMSDSKNEAESSKLVCVLEAVDAFVEMFGLLLMAEFALKSNINKDGAFELIKETLTSPFAVALEESLRKSAGNSVVDAINSAIGGLDSPSFVIDGLPVEAIVDTFTEVWWDSFRNKIIELSGMGKYDFVDINLKLCDAYAGFKMMCKVYGI